jgi:hypothetical protein
LGERALARAVLERDPATIGADQRKIREYVAEQLKETGGV